MQRFFSVLAVLGLVTVAVSAQYCVNVPSGFNCATPDEFIANVTVGAVSNNSLCGPGYEDYSSQVPGFVGGGSYPISVTVGQWYDANDNVAAFVDWNGDFDFDDAGEQFPLVQGIAGPSVVYSGTITAPATIVNNPRLRVVLFYLTTAAACAPIPEFYGNVEDYGHGSISVTWFAGGPGSIGFSLAGGDANGVYAHIITFNGTSYPNGWFYGLNTTFNEISTEINAGFPFVGPLDGNGAFTIGPIGGLPSGLTVYSVAFSTPGGPSTVVSSHSAPATFTIP